MHQDNLEMCSLQILQKQSEIRKDHSQSLRTHS